MKCGVPQGLILGPLAVSIYINDLCIVCKSIEPVLFVDDTNVFSSDSNVISLQDGFNNVLAIIAEWLKVNKLSLNIKKTRFICFSARNRSSPRISLQIDGRKPVQKIIKIPGCDYWQQIELERSYFIFV